MRQHVTSRSFCFAVPALTSAVALAAMTLVPAPATAAAGGSRLVLEVSGVAAAQGSPAYATARLGACGTIIAEGTVMTNDRAKDAASFTESIAHGGGCGEAGPNFEGTIESAKVTAQGDLKLLGTMTYITSLPKFCTYRITQLEGAFTVPGSTSATVSGVGTRVGSRATGCAKTEKLKGVEAKLGPTELSPGFEAVLG